VSKSKEATGSARLDLDAILPVAQKDLGLSDWYGTIRYGTAGELNGALGRCRYSLRLREFEVLVLDPEHYHHEFGRRHDVEQTVYHELTHLHFAPFQADDWNTPEGTSQEQAIDALAWAVVNAKRAAQ
jgi:hypothetical protein